LTEDGLGIILGIFIKFECQGPLHKRKAPLSTTFWRRFWFRPHILSHDGIVAFDSLQSEKVRNTGIVNLDCRSCIHFGAFYLTCFARVCEIFTAVVSEWQYGPHVLL